MATKSVHSIERRNKGDGGEVFAPVLMGDRLLIVRDDARRCSLALAPT